MVLAFSAPCPTATLPCPFDPPPRLRNGRRQRRLPHREVGIRRILPYGIIAPRIDRPVDIQRRGWRRCPDADAAADDQAVARRGGRTTVGSDHEPVAGRRFDLRTDGKAPQDVEAQRGKKERAEVHPTQRGWSERGIRKPSLFYGQIPGREALQYGGKSKDCPDETRLFQF